MSPPSARNGPRWSRPREQKSSDRVDEPPGSCNRREGSRRKKEVRSTRLVKAQTHADSLLYSEVTTTGTEPSGCPSSSGTVVSSGVPAGEPRLSVFASVEDGSPAAGTGHGTFGALTKSSRAASEKAKRRLSLTLQAPRRAGSRLPSGVGAERHRQAGACPTGEEPSPTPRVVVGGRPLLLFPPRKRRAIGLDAVPRSAYIRFEKCSAFRSGKW